MLLFYIIIIKKNVEVVFEFFWRLVCDVRGAKEIDGFVGETKTYKVDKGIERRQT